MKRAQLAAVFLVMAAASATAWAQAPAWKEVAPPGCQCSVQMPGEPTESKQSFDTDIGKVDAYMYILPADGGTTAFLLGYNDYNKEKVKGANKQKMLEGAKNGAVTNVKGKLIGEKKVEVAGYPGIEIEVEVPPKDGQPASKVFARIVIANNRLYQTLVVMKASGVRGLDVRKFLDSLKITLK
jgi:hypothetical protein